jgi:putative FmdB family regulatory protein
MPIYEYQCRACGHQLEVLQKVSDAPLKKCPECGKPRLQKLLSAPSFRLKGGGWYETDFKSGKKKNLADSGKEEKPAAKEESKPAKEQAKPKTEKPAKGGGKSKAADT